MARVQSERVSKLLSHSALWGIEGSLIIEGAFIQLRDTSESWRQVYLGITEREFLIATQIPLNYIQYPEVVYLVNADPELDGLELNSVYPLKLIHFYVIENRSRRFAVCTCTGQVYYFELCQFTNETEDFWTHWCSEMTKYGNVAKLGFNMWKPDFVPSKKKRKNLKSGTLYYIKQPFSFTHVKSIGVGTKNNAQSHSSSDTKEDTSDLKENLEFMPQKGLVEGDDAQFVEDFAKVTGSFRFLYFQSSLQFHPSLHGLQLHYISGNSLSESDIGSLTDWISTENKVNLTKCYSLPDLHGNGTEQTLSNTQKFCADMERYLLSAINKKCDIGKSSLPFLVTRRLCKILKSRESLASKTVVINSSESEESITDLVPSRQEKLSRWRNVYKKVREDMPQKKPLMTDTVELVRFFTCEKKSEIVSLQSFTPLEVATELTLLMRRMVLRTTQTSILECCSRKHGELMLSQLLPVQFSERISNWVAKEIIEKSGSELGVWTLQFFIQVASKLVKHRDLESASTVLRGLQLAPVVRLNETWDLLIKRMPRLMGAYLNICATMEGTASFHKFKNDFPRMLQSRLPFLPRIEHFMLYCMNRPFPKGPSARGAKGNFIISEQLSEQDFSEIPQTESVESMCTEDISLSEKGFSKLPIGTVLKKMKALNKVKIKTRTITNTFSNTVKKTKEKVKKMSDKKGNAPKRQKSEIKESSKDEEASKKMPRKWFWRKKKSKVSESDMSIIEESPGEIMKNSTNRDDRPSTSVKSNRKQRVHGSESHTRATKPGVPDSDVSLNGKVLQNSETRGGNLSVPVSEPFTELGGPLPRPSREVIEKEEELREETITQNLGLLQGGTSDSTRKSIKNYSDFFEMSAGDDDNHTVSEDEKYINNNAFRKKSIHFLIDEEPKQPNQNQNPNEQRDGSLDKFCLDDCEAWQLFLLVQIAVSRYSLKSKTKLRLYLKTHLLSDTEFSLFQMSQEHH